ncbi:MAG: adenylate kinase [Bifidobacteriaceae bacterium]|jgi:adenylate kinase|nr:adenylate kinase [Bifidobacteriaceae bacterium]
MKLLIIGPQGVGKGTQAKLISEKFNAEHISTGDIFRYNISNETELGLKIKSIIESGNLVDDELTCEIVFDKLSSLGDSSYILDGFPRNLSQAQNLNSYLSDNDQKLDVVVVLDADRSVLIDRINKRAIEEGRSDDTPESIKQRLSIYDTQTAPIINYYNDLGITTNIDGVQTVENVFEDISLVLNSFN